MDAVDKIRARNLRNMGRGWNEVARKLEVSVERLRRAVDPGYAERRRLSAKVHRAKSQKQRERSDLVNCATLAATRRMAERLLKRRARGHAKHHRSSDGRSAPRPERTGQESTMTTTNRTTKRTDGGKIVMTDDRQLAKPVEELARALILAEGGRAFADDPQQWEREAAVYRQLVRQFPGYAASHSLLATAFRQARTAIDTLRELGMINDIGLEAIKAEEREA